jgi:hypothetical protein
MLIDPMHIKAEMDRSGDSLHTCKQRLKKDALLKAAAKAREVYDLRLVLIDLIEELM